MMVTVVQLIFIWHGLTWRVLACVSLLYLRMFRARGSGNHFFDLLLVPRLLLEGPDQVTCHAPLPGLARYLSRSGPTGVRQTTSQFRGQRTQREHYASRGHTTSLKYEKPYCTRQTNKNKHDVYHAIGGPMGKQPGFVSSQPGDEVHRHFLATWI